MPIIISSTNESDNTISYTPSTPTAMKGRRIVGGDAGRGKAFEPPFTSKERRALRDSLDFVSSPQPIRRTAPAHPINGAPGQFKDEERHTDKDDVEHLFRVVGNLRKENRELEERMAELTLANYKLEDKFRTLRISTMAKLKHLAKAVGKEGALDLPSP